MTKVKDLSYRPTGPYFRAYLKTNLAYFDLLCLHRLTALSMEGRDVVTHHSA